MEFILELSKVSINDREKTGDKAIALSKLIAVGVPVPEGFVVTNSGFFVFARENNISDAISGLLNNIGSCGPDELAIKSKNVREMILAGKMPKELKDEIKLAYSALSSSLDMAQIDTAMLGTINAESNDVTTVVRTSVSTSGSKKISFKGFYKPYLFVSGIQGIIDKIKESWANIYSDEAIFARQKYNGGLDIFSGIIIQKMIDGEKSGVCATANPVTNNTNEIMIESSFGCGLTTNGEITPDIFIMDKTTSSHKGEKINLKEWRMIRHAVSGNVIREKVSPELTSSRSIDVSEMKSIGDIAKNIESYLKYPVYVKWVYKRDKLYVLDISKITTINKPIKPIYETTESPDSFGICANSGNACGSAIKVHNVADVVKVRAGNIFVVTTLEPSSILILNRVGGVISEKGGILSNMSILCRELDIPYIVGCSGIFEKVTDGFKIVMDATTGKIYITLVETINEDDKDISITQQDIPQSESYGLDESSISEIKDSNTATNETPFGTINNTSAIIASDNLSELQPNNNPVKSKDILDNNKNYVDYGDEISPNSDFNSESKETLPVNETVNHSEKIEDINMIEENPLDIITGTKVKVLASGLDVPEEILDGIGLFPTEFVLLNLGKHPDKILAEGMESELIKYLETKFSPIVESAYPKPVTFRTLSAQTSTLAKLPEGNHEELENNPKLGWRGIRRTLDSPAIFKAEIKALNNLVLKGYKNIEVLLPFVHHPKQISDIHEILKECIGDTSAIKVGMSIEAPAVGLTATEFAKAGVDFVFIDTDRLAEHMLGIDSSNERTKKHFDTRHPGILRMIKIIIDGYKKNKVPVMIGGSILNEPDVIEKLVEFGVDDIVVPQDKAKVSKYIAARAERKMLLDVMRERSN